MDTILSLYQFEDILLSWTPFFVAVPIYLMFLVCGSYLLRNSQPLNVQRLLAAHNLFLCVLSILMVIGGIWETVSVLVRYGLEESYCSGMGTGRLNTFFTGRIWFWCFLFYASKYYELLDTVFIVLRRRPLTFLHVYHHIVTIAICLAFMRSRLSISLIGVITNATIHTFMYYYFWKQTLGKSVWWKKYLTTAQIVQFFLDSFSVLPFGFVCIDIFDFKSPIVRLWWMAQFVLVSFILLFWDFYRKTYKKEEVTTSVSLHSSTSSHHKHE